MPAISREEALSRAVEYSESAQHTLHGQFGWKNDWHGNAVKGYQFEDPNGTLYRVYGPADKSYMLVSSDFNVVTYIAERLTEDDIQHYLGQDEAYTLDESEKKSIIAARAYLDTNVDDEEMEDIAEEMFDRMYTTDTRQELQWTENGTLKRFLVHRTIFPYHEGFNPETFMSAVRAVTEVGRKAAVYYLNEIEIEDLSPEPDQTRDRNESDSDNGDSGSGGRMFQ